MKVAVYSSRPWDESFLSEANTGHELVFLKAGLDPTTISLAAGCEAVCLFVNDTADAQVIGALASLGVHAIVLRSAGFNHIDLDAANANGIVVVRVPAYSPHAVAEHTIGLMLAVNRRIPRAHNRVRDGDFRLNGLLGVDMVGKTAGVIGTGKIGAAVARILVGFGMEVVAHDPYPNDEVVSLGARYVGLDELFGTSAAISLHCPLTPDTYHLIDEAAIGEMKQHPMLVNTSRGSLIDTVAAIEGLKSGQLGALAIDVYEEEGDLFFKDLSDTMIQDDVFSRLLTLPNVLVTGHQAFFTREAVGQIAATTIANLDALATGEVPPTVVTSDLLG
ncbi:MAG: 2-hydroxyacid dehydrogenase [Acidimicrobiia bacterium]